jgi:DNA polymerase I-like protein with 3'-5' exonuclease and polymerase domains
MGNVAVVDLEADGFLYGSRGTDKKKGDREATQVFCIAVKDLDTGINKLFEPLDIEEGLRYIDTFNTIVLHNGIGYDLPLLDKLYGWKYKGDVVDTLILSRMAYPFRISHSLSSWGEDLGSSKIDYNNFDYYEEEMGVYCKQDVEVTARLYNKLISRVDPTKDYIQLENEVLRIQTEASMYGVSFDEESAVRLLQAIDAEMESLQQEVDSILGNHIEVYKTKLKKDGNPNVHAQKRINQGFTYRLDEEFCYIDEVTQITFDTKKLFINRLLELGWKPTWLTEKGMPQITRQGAVEPNLSNIPGMKGVDIGKYFVLKHRRALVDGLFRHIRSDGKIPSEANTLGAVTGRYTHRKIANLPAIRSLYGEEIRALFGVEPGRVQVGADLAGIEARMLAHYMDDPSYTKEVLEGDIHTANQVAAGLPTRDSAKTFFYGFLYGAGDAKVGALVNGNANDGKRVKEQFLNNLPSLKKLINTKQKEARMGFVRSLDNRPVFITRSKGFDGIEKYDDRKALNSLLQSSATVFFKRWLLFVDKYINFFKLDVKLMISYHDEGQWSVADKDVQKFKEGLQKALEATDKYYKVKCRNDIDIKTGKNWMDCH